MGRIKGTMFYDGKIPSKTIRDKCWENEYAKITRKETTWSVVYTRIEKIREWFKTL